MSSVSIPATPTTPASNQSPQHFRSIFPLPSPEQDEQRERLLKALSEPSGSGPLAPTINNYFNDHKPKWARYSVEMGERSNADCVLAAFSSARGEMRDFHRIAGRNTSTDDDIKQIAKNYGMKKIDPKLLRGRLKEIDMSATNIKERVESSTPRAFIQVPALGGGRGRYHAYAAFGIDSKTKKVIAWDPDKEEYRRMGGGIRGVPNELIELAFI